MDTAVGIASSTAFFFFSSYRTTRNCYLMQNLTVVSHKCVSIYYEMKRVFHNQYSLVCRLKLGGSTKRYPKWFYYLFVKVSSVGGFRNLRRIFVKRMEYLQSHIKTSCDCWKQCLQIDPPCLMSASKTLNSDDSHATTSATWWNYKRPQVANLRYLCLQ